jgi:hypothetical protein
MKYLLAVVVAVAAGACMAGPTSTDAGEDAEGVSLDDDAVVRAESGDDALAAPDAALAVGALTLSASARARLDRRYAWDMRVADPEPLELGLDEVRVVSFPVEIVNTAVTEDGFHVDGPLVVSNVSKRPAVVARVLATAGDVRATVTCPVALPTSVPAGATLTCQYSASLPDRRDQVVRALVVGSGAASVDQPVRFGDPTTQVYVWDALVEATASGVGHVYLTDGRNEPSVHTGFDRQLGPFTACGGFEVAAHASLRALNGLGSTRSDRVNINLTATARGQVRCP